MTLSPVFRSQAAVRLLEEQGVWRRLAPDVQAQADAVRTLYADLREVLGSEFRAAAPHVPSSEEALRAEGLHFVQEYFFLILFRSIFAALGVPADRLRLYAELNFCIKGTITAADNLFDDQDKSLLPLAPVSGARFRSILQLLAFERLLRRALDRAQHAGLLDGGRRDAVLRGLLDRMASIGRLEGSEEGGVDEVPTPEEMVEGVHRVRGGALFALAFAAPSVLEEGEMAVRFAAAEPAVARLGTAFQIVDDLTDFEFDLGRRSHNLLASQVFHHGSEAEKAALARFRDGEPVAPGVVESLFRGSARAVLERAYGEARASFRALAELGHWLDPALSDEVVHAIVGLDGVARMEALTSLG
ncbi:MAG: class 1 isoprenoid biosynthesis enzyme [Gemmatimonadetes bacterium]|nr:class 1 isoprenoid biosynthesis enzyme [Gemmatimonadota bacterium]